eukprot:Gregarina_sp_Pseudo_9__6001@NODE_995_length_1992_cov_5_190988_g933_i0_p2_GENE_NODE_995_length_1992_cov_5_190988_g933_i0NODE_995_length_1992_cov_5_190988_g933_i0_p2_ORF_typecomplete_len158_score35_46RFC1/PF08519_12/5_2e10DUF3245/PF11595_8/0_049HNF1_N/PF04814_13/2_8e02HNF1_N/PF04814_13/17_NODE_995_length_1992_cov_5_190988_g933_i066539
MADGYYEALGDELVRVLKEDSLDVPERIEEFMENIAAYGLSKDLVLENLMETRYTRNTPTPYEKVDSKVKTALTKAWNAASQQVTKKTTTAKKGAGAKRKALGSSPSTAESSASPAGKRKRIASIVADPEDTEEDEEGNSELIKEKEEEERKMGGII